MTRRLMGICCGCWFLLVSADPCAAAGDGRQLGPSLLFPSLTVTATHDDNIGLTTGDTQSGWVTTVSPALRLLLPVRRFYLEAEGGLDILRYSDSGENDATNWLVGAVAGADFPGGLHFKVGDTHIERYLVGSQEYGPGEDSSINTLTATAGYVIRDALRLELGGLRTAYRYAESDRRERVERAFQADLFWKFRPRLSALIEGSLIDYAYDSNTAQDGSATQVALGLTWDLTAKSTGLAKVGYQWKRYSDEDPSLGTESAQYSTVSAVLKHVFTRRTNMQVDIARASQESDFPENPYYLQNALGASISQRFTAKIYGRAGLRYAHDGYPSASSYDNPYDPGDGLQKGKRTDKTLVGRLAVGFDATRWLALELEYGRDRRDSTYDTFDYTATRVSFSAKAAFEDLVRTPYAFALGLLLGLAFPAAVPAATDLVHQLGPRDLLQIKVYQQPDLTQEIRIDDDGTVTLPLVGQVRAAGLTVEAFSRDLAVRYKEYLFNPEITVFVKEYYKREIEVSVLGEVGRPGFYRFPEKSTLLDVIAQVGGLKPESGERVIVLRPKKAGESGEADAFVVNAQELFTPSGVKTQNLELLEGDTVQVPRADQYFIFGEVVRPGAYKLEKGTTLTVLKAIILAGGFTDKAGKKGIKITREEGPDKHSVKADLDTLVRSQDIIIVPESFF